jgi:hypothetical protein
MKKIFLALGAAAMLSGCYSMQGSERVLNRDGYVTKEVPEAAIFRSDFERAFSARRAGTVSQTEVNAMLSSGFTHIYSYCDNYFDVMAVQQRKSRVARDTIAPIASLITGVLALHNFEKNPGRKEDILAVIGLTTGAAASALDIYDEHMLFGAENIGAVEKLTRAAISEHSSQVMLASNISFDAAIRHLLDNQAVCSPQHILSLTREAIREGKVAARPVNTAQGDGRSVAPAGGVGPAPTVPTTPPAQDGNKRVEVTIENDG